MTKDNPFLLLQNEPRDHPVSGDDVCSVSLVTLECRRSVARARDRHQPRDSPVLEEPFWPNVRFRYSSEKDQSYACLIELALASG